MLLHQTRVHLMRPKALPGRGAIGVRITGSLSESAARRGPAPRISRRGFRCGWSQPLHSGGQTQPAVRASRQVRAPDRSSCRLCMADHDPQPRSPAGPRRRTGQPIVRSTSRTTPRPIHPSSPVSTASSAASKAFSARSDDPVRHREQARGQRPFRAPHFLHIALTLTLPADVLKRHPCMGKTDEPACGLVHGGAVIEKSPLGPSRPSSRW